MSSRLVNVRLDEDRLRKARRLRETGVVLSDLVREAIDERFEELSAHREPHDVQAVVRRIFEQYPDQPNLPPLTYNVHDPTEARQAIVRKLRRRRR